MDPSATIFKTAKGVEEIETKKFKLSVRTRTLLILVDGVKKLNAIREMAVKLGLPPGLIDELIEQGFVEVKSAPAAVRLVAAGDASGADGNPTPSAPATEPAPMANEHEKFRVAKKFINDAIVNSLGIKAFFFTLKLEKCGTRQELSELLEPFSNALAKSRGVQESALLTQHARDLLNA